MSKRMNKYMGSFATLNEAVAVNKQEAAVIARRHETELEEHRSKLEEVLKEHDACSNEILRRIANTAEVIRNVVAKKFDYETGKAFLNDSNLTWVGTVGRGAYTPFYGEPENRDKYARVVSAIQGEEFMTVKVESSAGVKTWWVPKGFLTSSTWDVAKVTRLKIYAYKLSLKELKVEAIQKELAKAKREHKAHLKNVSEIAAKLEKANKKVAAQAGHLNP